MNLDTYIVELFKDLKKHTQNPLINDPVILYSFDELEQNYKNGWTLFLVKEEPILAYLNQDLFLFTRKSSLLSLLKKKTDNVVVFPNQEYIFRLLHTIILDLNGMTLEERPYEQYRSDFINKIVYFLEIPIDGYILSKYDIYPDIEATTIQKVVPTDHE